MEDFDDCLPPPIELHPELEELFNRETEGWNGEYIPIEVDIVYPQRKSPFLSITAVSAMDHHEYFVDIQCTRLERVRWGVEVDPYKDNE